MDFTLDTSAWFSTFGLIFAIIDPFGYVPIFLSMTSNDTPERRRVMLKRAVIASFLILMVFTVLGTHILNFFGISIPALQISGGVILTMIGLEMLKVLPVGEKLAPSEENEAFRKEDISIIPLAVPMLAGPASITTVVVLGAKTNHPANYAMILSCVAATLIVTYFVLRSAHRVLKIVGVTGLNVLTRIMGLLLTAMAAQLILNGLVTIFKTAA